MPLARTSVDRLIGKLRIDTPIIALYDSEPSEEFAPLVESKGRTCCFAYYKRWLKGETLVIGRGGRGFSDPDKGCYGGQSAFGLGKGYPPYMPNFLTDGKGAPMGEGLKASPALAKEFLDRAKPPEIASGYVLIGPLRLSMWERVRSVTFFVDPDRLSALMTLAGYWTADPEAIYAPFSSGCGLLWRELEAGGGKRAVIGCTDIAMRKYLPPEILCLTVSPSQFERMVEFPGDSFLNKSWWNDLMDLRGKERRGSV
jgi:hypothetical protein